MYDFSTISRPGLPPASQPWSGFPRFNFVGGHNDPESIPIEQLLEASQQVLSKHGSQLATYSLNSGPQGYLPLREFLVQKLKKYASIECVVDDLLITSGSLQAMDLINNVLLQSGDTVIVEESNYGGALSRLNAMSVQQVAIPVDEQGMQTQVLETELAGLANTGIKPKYIYTIPTVHNPTATILTLERRKHLLEIAKKYDVAVYEDECYADLIWDGTRPPSLHALDGDGRVVHIGSFSKTIAPALRVGYVLANWSLMGSLLATKTDAGSGALEQMVLAEFCHQHFDEHLSALKVRLQKKLDVLVASLDREFGTAVHYDYPPGGIFLWVQLPEEVNTQELARTAASAGIAVNPGPEWSLQNDSSRFIRLCFAKADANEIEAGVASLAEVCHNEFGTPEFGANKPRA